MTSFGRFYLAKLVDLVPVRNHTFFLRQAFVVCYFGLTLIIKRPNRIALETHDGFQFVDIRKLNIPDVPVIFAAWAFFACFSPT